jgi:hypothetical protein
VAQEYADAYVRLRARLPWNSIVYAGADVKYFDDAIYARGLRPDAWSYHYYPTVAMGLNQPSDNDSLAFSYGAPVLDTEGNFDVWPRDNFTLQNAVDYFMGMYNSMGTRPWCYWDGPVTSPKLAGLFSTSVWDYQGQECPYPTDTYNAIRAYFP